MLKGYVHTFIPYLYIFILNLNPNFFKLIITLIPTLIPITMALIEKEWAAIANKYGYRINADKAIKNKLIEFIQTIIYIYIYKTS